MAEIKVEQITPEQEQPNGGSPEFGAPVPEGIKSGANEAIEQRVSGLDKPAPIENGVPVFAESGVAEKQGAAAKELPAGADLIAKAVGKVLEGKEDIESLKAPPDQILDSLLEEIGKENQE